ncbi:MAG: helix-turn-helix transcriptional regulator [Slackia sp.]|nr:helix-turn-helix transcriptional regulator [Slackia sp.]
MLASLKDAGLCAVFAAIGLTVNLTWCTVAGHTPGFTDALASLGIPVNPRAFFLAGILAMSLMFAAFPQKMREKDASLWPVVALSACIGTACFAIASSQDAFPPAVLAIGGLLLFGIGYFWLTARFVLLLARTQSFGCSIACLIASLIVEPVLVSGIEHALDANAQLSVVVVLPLLSAALFQCARHAALKQRACEKCEKGRRTVFGVPSRPRTAAKLSEKGDLRGAFILMTAASLLLATVRSLSFVGLWGEGHLDGFDQPSMTSHAGLWLAYSAALAVFAYLALGRTSRWALHLRFQPSFLVIILTLSVSMILAGDAGGDPALLDTLMRLNDSFSHSMFWAVVVILLDASAIPSYRIIGGATALYAAGSIAWVLFLGNTDAVENLIVIIAIYALTIASMRFSWSKREPAPKNDSKTDAATVVTDALEKRCAEVAEAYKLSPRESEVLVLLAQGRTRTYIQEELVLAENTVKSHVAHIYTKLGVRDRQDMIDIVLGLVDPKSDGGPKTD